MSTASSDGSSSASPPRGIDPSLSDRLLFRTVTPFDIPRCRVVERDSYPPDEAASKSTLQYRQHHAAPFFRCAVLLPPDYAMPGSASLATDSMKMTGEIVGFICSTRCWDFTAESMAVHDPTGPTLAVHSVVVSEPYRRMGLGGAMLSEYVRAVRRMELKSPLERIVLISKADKLGFYVRAGFSVTRPSPIVHGREMWYECELDLMRGGGDGEGDGGRPCRVVDSFAIPGVGGSGNPAGVVLMSSESNAGAAVAAAAAEGWMRTVAREFNLPETAFVWERPAEGGGGGEDEAHYGIRYFTRTGVEVDLCGHATLASASVLFEGSGTGGRRRRPVRTINFRANRDVLRARVSPGNTWGVQIENGDSGSGGSGSGGGGGVAATRIAMDFPWRAVREVREAADRRAILGMVRKAFRLSEEVILNSVLFVGMDETGEDVLVELTRPAFLGLGRGPSCVHHSALASWGGGYTRGVILCCLASPEDGADVDFLSRFFAPKVGIDEDPVTGSAHCALGPYFGGRLEKSELVGRQMSDRGGVVECILKAEAEGGMRRVGIVGTAVTTMSGTLYI